MVYIKVIFGFGGNGIPRIEMETCKTQITQYLKLHRVFLPVLVNGAVHYLKTLYQPC